MAKPAIKVELEFDDTTGLRPFFTLDSATQGVLDNTEYPLAGLTFFDITEYVAGLSTSRGASRELDRYPAGVASVTFNNDTRIFDPLNTSSVYASQLKPKRQLRISANGSAIYLGVVDDWNLQYDLVGNNVTIANCVDKFTYLAQQTLAQFAVTSQLSGARVEAVLNRPEVAWDSSQRTIDAGNVTLLAGTVALGTNALEYLQDITYTENGTFFIGNNGYANFQDGLSGPSTANLITFSSENDGIPFTEIEVVYGSELLYTRVQITNIQGITVVGDSTSAQADYGILTLERTNFLADATEEALLVVSLLNRYDEPEYRFERLLVDITNLSSTYQAQILGAEITNVSKIRFQPNNIGVVIEKYAQIIGIKHAVDSKRHMVEFRFRTLDFAPFVLDDVTFGVLGGATETYNVSQLYDIYTLQYDGTITGNRLG